MYILLQRAEVKDKMQITEIRQATTQLVNKLVIAEVEAEMAFEQILTDGATPLHPVRRFQVNRADCYGLQSRHLRYLTLQEKK